MNASILIVTHATHLPFFRLCAKSLNRHARGFKEVVVVVPTTSYDAFAEVPTWQTADGVWFTLRHHFEASERGHWWMNATKCCADLYAPEAEMICHLDSDVIMTASMTPESYLSDGKIIMAVRRWEGAGQAICWRGPTERALGMASEFETMQSPQLAYFRENYRIVRDRIERVHREPFLHYALTHHVPEFDTLGTLALAVARSDYRLVDLTGQPPNSLPTPLRQSWSHLVGNAEKLQEELARLDAAIG